MAQLEQDTEDMLLNDIEEAVAKAIDHVQSGHLKRAAKCLTKAAGFVFAQIDES